MGGLGVPSTPLPGRIGQGRRWGREWGVTLNADWLLRFLECGSQKVSYFSAFLTLGLCKHGLGCLSAAETLLELLGGGGVGSRAQTGAPRAWGEGRGREENGSSW